MSPRTSPQCEVVHDEASHAEFCDATDRDKRRSASAPGHFASDTSGSRERALRCSARNARDRSGSDAHTCSTKFPSPSGPRDLRPNAMSLKLLPARNLATRKTTLSEGNDRIDGIARELVHWSPSTSNTRQRGVSSNTCMTPDRRDSDDYSPGTRLPVPTAESPRSGGSGGRKTGEPDHSSSGKNSVSILEARVWAKLSNSTVNTRSVWTR